MSQDENSPELTAPLDLDKSEEREKLAEVLKLYNLFSSINEIRAFNEFIRGTTEKELYDLYGEEVADETIHNNIENFYDIEDHFPRWDGEEIIYHTNYQTKNPLEHADENEYQLTPIGQHIAEIYQEMVNVADYYFEALPLLRHLEGWYEILGREELQQIRRENITEYLNAREVGSIRTDFNRSIQGATSIREILTWNAHDNWIEQFTNMFVDGDAAGELILRRSQIIEKAPDEGGMSRETAEILTNNGVSLFVYEGHYPGVLTIADDKVTLWGWGPDEDYTQAAVYEGEGLNDWAKNQFEEIKRKADPKWDTYDWEEN